MHQSREKGQVKHSFKNGKPDNLQTRFGQKRGSKLNLSGYLSAKFHDLIVVCSLNIIVGLLTSCSVTKTWECQPRKEERFTLRRTQPLVADGALTSQNSSDFEAKHYISVTIRWLAVCRCGHMPKRSSSSVYVLFLDKTVPLNREKIIF